MGTQRFKEIGGIQRIVSQKLIGITVKLVGAGPRNSVNDPA